MGIFVDYHSNIFLDLKNIPQNIVTANTNVLWITDINICNKGPAPIRFNLQKVRVQGFLNKICYAATTANIPTIIYNNGSSGVGATLTNNSSTLTAFIVDGISPPLNSRILVKNQTSSFQNGIYKLTTIGSNSVPWILTRATDYNKATQIHVDDLIFITTGTVNISSTWAQTSDVLTIGTSPITFIKNVPLTINLMNEFEIKPYTTIDVIDIIGIIHLRYNVSPFITDSLICFSNGYTQVFDCDVNYTQLNELPLI